jgi:hypothetical protein
MGKKIGFCARAVNRVYGGREFGIRMRPTGMRMPLEEPAKNLSAEKNLAQVSLRFEHEKRREFRKSLWIIEFS